MRGALKRTYQRRLARGLRRWSAAELRAPALVLAPHPDDETLGCGATIAAKCAAGARVQIVFMTDGANSHPHLMPPSQLRALRRTEGLAAATELGVAACDVHFLDLPDGQLRQREPEAIARLRPLLALTPAEQVFVPYRGDGMDDHVTTHRIFQRAAAGLGRRFTVFEYPVWFWRNWPWTHGRQAPAWLAWLRRTHGAVRWFWALQFELRAYAASPAAREHKQRALRAHRSQTTRHANDPAWTTLADLDGGEFLSCFDQPFEVFRAPQT